MKTYNIVDHNGYGTMHKLISNLENNFENQYLLTLSNCIQENKEKTEYFNKIVNEKNRLICIHSSGSKSGIILDNYGKIFGNAKNVVIFLHVSYDYLILKKKKKFLDNLSELCEKYNILIIVPSKEVMQQYKSKGFNCKVLQMGIPDIQKKKFYFESHDYLKKYYNKIITTCCSSKEIYQHVKGIDLFSQLINKNNLNDKALIAGIDLENKIIDSKKFTEDEFLNILCHSKMYVQLSRYESYNITACQAKRFKVPTILLNTEGTPSCMLNNVFNNLEEIEELIVRNDLDSLKTEELYNDSLIRESLSNFNENLESLFKGE